MKLKNVCLWYGGFIHWYFVWDWRIFGNDLLKDIDFVSYKPDANFLIQYLRKYIYFNYI